MLTAVILAAFCLPAAAGQDDLAALCPAQVQPGPADGSTTERWGGPGQDKITLGQRFYIPRRDRHLAAADASIAELTSAMQAVEQGKDLPALKQRITALAGAPLDRARVELLAAIALEQKRLRAVQTAVQQARRRGRSVPGVDPALVERRLKALAAPATRTAVDTYVTSLRELSHGLVAFIDGDRMAALEKAKAAAAADPRFALARIYVGSFAYLLEQYDTAREAWQKALELDPDNEAVRLALEGQGTRGGGKPRAKAGKQ